MCINYVGSMQKAESMMSSSLLWYHWRLEVAIGPILGVIRALSELYGTSDLGASDQNGPFHVISIARKRHEKSRLRPLLNSDGFINANHIMCACEYGFCSHTVSPYILDCSYVCPNSILKMFVMRAKFGTQSLLMCTVKAIMKLIRLLHI